MAAGPQTTGGKRDRPHVTWPGLKRKHRRFQYPIKQTRHPGSARSLVGTSLCPSEPNLPPPCSDTIPTSRSYSRYLRDMHEDTCHDCSPRGHIPCRDSNTILFLSRQRSACSNEHSDATVTRCGEFNRLPLSRRLCPVPIPGRGGAPRSRNGLMSLLQQRGVVGTFANGLSLSAKEGNAHEPGTVCGPEDGLGK